VISVAAAPGQAGPHRRPATCPLPRRRKGPGRDCRVGDQLRGV